MNEEMYENILPHILENNVIKSPQFIVKRGFAELEEALQQLLFEDKIPPQLLRAYRQDYVAINPRDIHQPGALEYGSSYTDYRNKLSHLVNTTTARNRITTYSRLQRGGIDLGKATYNKLSKQETVDYLGLNITVDGHELGISDPFPYQQNNRGTIIWPNLSVTSSLPNNTLRKNLSNLRFIIKGVLYILQLDADGYVNPLQRTQIPADAFEDSGVPVKVAGDGGERNPRYMHWHNYGNHADDARFEGKSLNNVYVWIKLADEIFETNDMSIEIVASNTGSTAGLEIDKVMSSISSYYKGIMYLQYVLNNIQMFKNAPKNDSNSSYRDSYCEELLQAIDNLSANAKNTIKSVKTIEDLIPLLKIQIDSSRPGGQLAFTHTISFEDESVQTAVKNASNISYFSYYYNNHTDSKGNTINDVQKEFNLDTYYGGASIKTISKVIDLVVKEIKADSPNLSDRSFELIRRAAEHEKTNYNSSMFRKDQTSTSDVRVEKIPGEHKYTPYDYLNNNGKISNYTANDMIDTGSHRAQDMLLDLQNAKKELIRRQKYYNSVKQNNDTYDNDLDYEHDLEQAKNTLIAARDIYLRYLTTFDKWYTHSATTYENMLNNIQDQYVRYQKQLQALYGKMRKISDSIHSLSTMNKQAILKTFGNQSGRSLEELQKAISECMQTIEDCNHQKNRIDEQIRDLQLRIVELTASKQAKDVEIEQKTKQIADINSEIASLSTTAEDALRKSYIARENLVKQGLQMDNVIDRFKQVHGITPATKQQATLKQDVEQFLSEYDDLMDSAEITSKEETELDADDVLTDDEE